MADYSNPSSNSIIVKVDPRHYDFSNERWLIPPFDRTWIYPELILPTGTNVAIVPLDTPMQSRINTGSSSTSLVQSPPPYSSSTSVPRSQPVLTNNETNELVQALDTLKNSNPDLYEQMMNEQNNGLPIPMFSEYDQDVLQQTGIAAPYFTEKVVPAYHYNPELFSIFQEFAPEINEERFINYSKQDYLREGLRRLWLGINDNNNQDIRIKDISNTQFLPFSDWYQLNEIIGWSGADPVRVGRSARDTRGNIISGPHYSYPEDIPLIRRIVDYFASKGYEYHYFGFYKNDYPGLLARNPDSLYGSQRPILDLTPQSFELASSGPNFNVDNYIWGKLATDGIYKHTNDGFGNDNTKYSNNVSPYRMKYYSNLSLGWTKARMAQAIMNLMLQHNGNESRPTYYDIGLDEPPSTNTKGRRKSFKTPNRFLRGFPSNRRINRVRDVYNPSVHNAHLYLLSVPFYQLIYRLLFGVYDYWDWADISRRRYYTVDYLRWLAKASYRMTDDVDTMSYEQLIYELQLRAELRQQLERPVTAERTIMFFLDNNIPMVNRNMPQTQRRSSPRAGPSSVSTRSLSPPPASSPPVVLSPPSVPTLSPASPVASQTSLPAPYPPRPPPSSQRRAPYIYYQPIFTYVENNQVRDVQAFAPTSNYDELLQMIITHILSINYTSNHIYIDLPNDIIINQIDGVIQSINNRMEMSMSLSVKTFTSNTDAVFV